MLLHRFPLINRYGVSNLASKQTPLVPYNAPVFSPSGVVLNGTTQYLQATIDRPASWSVSMWVVFVTTAGSIGLCATSNVLGNNVSIWGTWISAGSIYIGCETETIPSVAMPTTIPGNFHHLTITYVANGSARLYMDGKVIIDSNIPPTSNLVKNLSIGRLGDYGHYLNGTVADVRVYNHALTRQEVQKLFCDGANPMDSRKVDRKSLLTLPSVSRL